MFQTLFSGALSSLRRRFVVRAESTQTPTLKDVSQNDSPTRPLTQEELAGMHDEIVDCETKKRKALSSRRVQFMLHNLKTVGCPVPDPVQLIQCSPCDAPLAAAVVTDVDTGESNLVICQNKRLTQDMVTQAVTHELIHIYDLCRAKVNTCDHMACLEVRASMLSGECQFTQEFKRGAVGPFQFKDHLRKCVRRRALHSLKYNAMCKNVDECNESLDRVFERCFADRAPFYTIPHED